jgi:hypothetical protein
MLHNILLESDGYLDCESSDKQHIAHTVRGDCMELHVISHRNFLNETVAGVGVNKVNGGIEFNYLLIIMTNFVKDVTRSKIAR